MLNMLNTMRVLYVEDDDDIRPLMVQRLKRQVAELIVAENGKQGLELFLQTAPDMVVSDVQMPQMDGLAMASAIKSLNRQTPVILTTAFNETEYLLKAIDIGVDGYVIKPVKIELLLEAMVKSSSALFYQRELERQNNELQRLYELDRQDQAMANTLLQHMMQTDGLNDAQLRYYIQPAQEFSGDFIAATRSKNGDLVILLADVIGHGLQAAIFLVPISRAFYSMVKNGLSIPDIAAEINQTMRELAIPGHFIAAALVRIRCDQPMIEVWNGGIPTLLFIDNGGEVKREFTSRHPPLGIFSPQDFSEETESFHWETSGSLFLATDGLVEAENSKGESFGAARLLSTLCTTPPEHRIDAVLESITTHLAGNQAHDDMSWILVNCG